MQTFNLAKTSASRQLYLCKLCISYISYIPTACLNNLLLLRLSLLWASLLCGQSRTAFRSEWKAFSRCFKNHWQQQSKDLCKTLLLENQELDTVRPIWAFDEYKTHGSGCKLLHDQYFINEIGTYWHFVMCQLFVTQEWKVHTLTICFRFIIYILWHFLRHVLGDCRDPCEPRCAWIQPELKEARQWAWYDVVV